jgi:hypothetical protein
MIKTDFAELKEKLLCFDDESLVEAKILAQKRPMLACETYFLKGSEYQHTKSAAIITELLEIIQSQSEALDNIANHNTMDGEKYNSYDAAYSGVVEYADSYLSETNTRLQKLRNGKNGK